jgi:xanthine/CO dehydrogenase XdhC/CoxF family maturation factor
VSAHHVIEAFENWRERGEWLALATVVETAGSTYTKAGHRIIINDAGQFQGLVSGGCLEGDLAAHAREVISSESPKLLTYDLRGEADELFGLGIGCNGMFRVLLQALTPQTGYEPFSSIVNCLQGSGLAAVATVTESADPGTPPGATLVLAGSDARSFRIPESLTSEIRSGCAGLLQDPRAATRTHVRREHPVQVLYAPLWPLPRLLVLGASLDAVPLVAMAAQLGWRVTVVDHRPANLLRGDLSGAEDVRRVVPAELADSLSLSPFDAAVVMSHHLDSDRHYLHALAGAPIAYVGLLGPIGRRDRLLGDLGPAAGKLRGHLHAPIGLSIGADSPETIALAVLAEIQSAFARERAGTQTA